MGRVAQAGARGAQDSLSRFVEGPDGGGGGGVGSGARQQQQQRQQRQAPIDESRKAFWDDFSAVADQRHGTGPRYSSIGTSAMGKAGNKNAAPPPAGAAGGAAAKKDDEWDDW